MEISEQTKRQLTKLSTHYCQWVTDTLQFEMGHDETWPAVRQTITDAFNRIPSAADPVATAVYVRNLSLHFSAHKLKDKPCWERVRSSLLRLFSDQRGAIFEIAQLLRAESGAQ